ncbi:MAG: ribose-phosphate pyrophosphokinase [Phycisphaerales bacterium]|nr:ribose-phosphate pyrophosphokinase [Phycisphaerales bacterium]MBT7171355.1 ribose-phosphate pyrophosphokinase [Phycisphaerales bacterium]
MNMILFTGTSNPELGKKIADYLGMSLGKARFTQFPDGETFVKVEDDIRGRDVYFIQSTCTPVNDSLMELLLFVDSARRASAKRITVVIPYYGYARQDRKDEGRTPITAKLVANMVAAAGSDRVLTMDLHAMQIQGFFDIPVDNLLAEPVLSKYYAAKGIDDLVLVSPDVGNVKRARVYAQRLGADLAIIDKRRVSGDTVETSHLIGDVKDRAVLMVDDMISTAGTICSAAKLCQDQGAKKIFVGATHGVLCGPAVERLAAAPIDEVVVTDTIPVSADILAAIPTLKVLTVSALLGEAIHRIHNNESVSSLFLRDSE